MAIPRLHRLGCSLSRNVLVQTWAVRVTYHDLFPQLLPITLQEQKNKPKEDELTMYPNPAYR